MDHEERVDSWRSTVHKRRSDGLCTELFSLSVSKRVEAARASSARSTESASGTRRIKQVNVGVRRSTRMIEAPALGLVVLFCCAEYSGWNPMCLVLESRDRRSCVQDGFEGAQLKSSSTPITSISVSMLTVAVSPVMRSRGEPCGRVNIIRNQGAVMIPSVIEGTQKRTLSRERDLRTASASQWMVLLKGR